MKLAIRLLSKIAAQPRWFRLLINMTTLVAIVVLGYYLIIGNIYRQLHQQEQIEIHNKKTLTHYIAKEKTLTILKGQVDKLKNIYTKLAYKLPSDSELPELIDQLSDLAHQSQLKIRILNPHPLEDAKDHAVLRIQLLCNGNFGQITQFISQLTNLPRIILMEKYTIKPIKTGAGDELLEIMMTLKTFSLLSANK